MGENVSWVLELSIKDGALEDFKSVLGEMVQATKSNEPGALAYEWYISDDGKTCRAFERYTDSAATMTHLQNFGQNFADRMLALSQPTGFTVHGNPSDEVRQVLGGFGAVYMKQIDGFAR